MKNNTPPLPRWADLLQQLATADSKDDGKQFLVTDRREILRRLLAGSACRLLAEGRLFLLYGQQPVAHRDIVLVSSHIDCVYRRCWCEEQADSFRGTFDNALTNAAVLHNLLEARFDAQVVVAFTGDEEKDSGGCHELVEYLCTQTGCRVRAVIVTDVTNEGWTAGSDFTLENDLGIDLFTAYRLVASLRPYAFSFLHEAEPDESWTTTVSGCPCSPCACPLPANCTARKASSAGNPPFPSIARCWRASPTCSRKRKNRIPEPERNSLHIFRRPADRISRFSDRYIKN